MKKFCVLLFLSLVAVNYCDDNPYWISEKGFEQVLKIVDTEYVKGLLKNLGPVASAIPFVGPAISAALSITVVITDETQAKLDKIIKELEKVNLIDQKLDGLSDQINRLNTRVKNEHDRTIFMIKMSGLIPILSSMDEKENQLAVLIRTYGQNPQRLKQLLDPFILDFKRDNNEFKLINQLFLEFGQHRSIFNDNINLGHKYQQGVVNSRNSRTSTQKALYDLSFLVLTRVMRSYRNFRCAISVSLQISQQTPVELVYVENSEKVNIEMFKQKTKVEFMKLNDNSDLESYINIDDVSRKEPSLGYRNIFQFFVTEEQSLADYDDNSFSCDGSCRHKGRTDARLGKCYGDVYACVPTGPVKLYESNRVGRLYDGFENADGKLFGTRSGNSALMSPGGSFSKCDLCECLCDQKNHPLTIRKIFTGKIEAIDGYVLTGLRFAESNGIIYLEPQFGKLLGMGFIGSTYWKVLPFDKRNEYETISKDINGCSACTMNLVSSNLKLPVGYVVTGFQLYVDESNTEGIRLKVFGKELLSFDEGILRNHEYEQKDYGIPYTNLKFNNRLGLDSFSDSVTVSRNVKVTFNISDFDTDASQSFVPYFDPSNVTFDQPAPLSMIGLVHYTNDDKYSGLIRPIIKSLDYRKFV